MSVPETPSTDWANLLRRDLSTPLHVQIEEHFRKQIHGRFWPIGFKLSSEEVLANDLNVARGTVRSAIKRLVDDGLLEQVQGRGTFVVATQQPSSPDTTMNGPLLSNGERLKSAGIHFTDRVLDREVLAALDPRSKLAGVKTLRFRRLRALMEGPDEVIESHVSLDALPDLENISSERIAAQPFHALLKRLFMVVFSSSEFIYSAVPAEGEIAELLQVEPGTPLLMHEQYSYDAAGQRIEYSHAWSRTDRRRQTVTIRGQ